MNCENCIYGDITDWEHNKTTCKRDWSKRNLLCFEGVCGNKANTKEDAEKHKQHTHLMFCFYHFLFCYRGLNKYPCYLLGCKDTKKF